MMLQKRVNWRGETVLEQRAKARERIEKKNKVKYTTSEEVLATTKIY